jgi:uncharacterized protein (TIGR02996 family)
VTGDRRSQLLEQIYADLDDDLARSVYADHLLELGGDDAWHGQLIRLQLDGAELGKAIRDRQQRALGLLARSYEVSWTRGFPERLRTRKWTRELIAPVMTSPYLPTIRAIEIGYMRGPQFGSLLAAPEELTSRITELNVCSLTPPQLASLIAAAERFPRLRRLGLALEPMADPPDQRLTPASLAAVFASALELEVIQKAITVGELDAWSSALRGAPPRLRQLELLSVNDAGDADAATVFTRSATGTFEPDLDPLVPMIAMLRADGDAGFESETRAWSLEQLRALGERLACEGLDGEAKTVRDVVERRRGS